MVAKYVPELCRLASMCCFNQFYLKEVLSNQFVCEVHNKAIQLLSDRNVTFSKAVKTAQSIGAVHIHSQALRMVPNLTVGPLMKSS